MSKKINFTCPKCGNTSYEIGEIRSWAVASFTELVTLDGGEGPLFEKLLKEEVVLT